MSRHVRDFSELALRAFDGPVELLFVDGAHRFVPARRASCAGASASPGGGRMRVHDAFSSVGVTPALLTATVGRPSWRYAGCEGSPAAYVRSPRARGGPRFRELREQPWFAGNLVRTALIAGGVARRAVAALTRTVPSRPLAARPEHLDVPLGLPVRRVAALAEERV